MLVLAFEQCVFPAWQSRRFQDQKCLSAKGFRPQLAHPWAPGRRAPVIAKFAASELSPGAVIFFVRVPFELGVVGHFGLAVRDPKKSAKWFQRVLGLKKQFDFDGGVAIGNDNVTIALHRGRPSPATLDHMSFDLPNMSALKKAVAHLKKTKVEIEDPGDEIGPEAPGSKNMGVWFYDIDGYRWELSVQGKR